MPPTRIVRYCCSEFKEIGGEGRLKITGVRWAESSNRKNNADLVRIIGKPKTMEKAAEEYGAEIHNNRKGGILLSTDNSENRRFVEFCYKQTSTTINPIVDWTNDEVWAFLGHYGCKSNPLYAKGKCRIGCVGCPLAGGKNQKRDFAQYPKYKENYIRAFDRMILRRKERGLPTVWGCGEECYLWWVGDDARQITFDNLLEV